MKNRVAKTHRRARRRCMHRMPRGLTFEPLEDRRLMALFPELSPLGQHTALAFQGAVTDSLSAAQPTDDFQITLGANQFAYLQLSPNSSDLQVQLTVLGPGANQIAQVSASSGGQTVTIPLVNISQAGQYTLRADRLAGSGGYSLDLQLNAVKETEAPTSGGANDTTATAQPFPTAVPLASGASRTMVTGRVGNGPIPAGVAYGLTTDEIARIDLDTNNQTYLAIDAGDATLLRAVSLAKNPVSGEYFALLELEDQAGHELVKLDTTTGIATLIGNTGRRFSSIAFDAAGNLYAAPVASDADAAHLAKLNTTTGASTQSWTVSTISGDRALAFNPQDGKLYLLGGSLGAVAVFESIDLTTGARTTLPLAAPGRFISGQTNIRSLSYAGANTFAISADNGQYWLSTAGAISIASNLTYGVYSLIISTPLTLANDAADVYSLPLAANEFITVQLAPYYANDAQIELLNSAGTVVAHGDSVYDETKWRISQFQAPSPGLYYVRVKSSVATDYQLTVTRAGGVEEADTARFNEQKFSLSSSVTGYMAAFLN